MKRGTSQLKRTRLRQRSPRREAERDDYAACVAQVARRDGVACKAREVSPCRGPLDPHHVLPVGEGGARCDPANVILLCRGHHDFAHQQRAAAEPLGIIRRARS